MFKFQYQNGKKRKSVKKLSGLQNGAIRRLQIGAGFRDYKSGQEGLKIGAALGISNQGKEISNQGRDYKLGQKGFQIEAGITNRCRTIEFPQLKPRCKSWQIDNIFVQYF